MDEEYIRGLARFLSDTETLPLSMRPKVEATYGLGAIGGVPIGRGLGGFPMDQASRTARAQQTGYRPNFPLSFGVAPADERIAKAAIHVNGRVFTGASHFDAITSAEKALGMPAGEMKTAPIWDGFMTTAGRFVSRREASDIAKREGQGQTTGLFQLRRGLAAEDAVTAKGRAGSPVRTGATEPGLPGGQGIWGRLVAEQTTDLPARTSVLWHRAARPGSFDARRLSDGEIQVNLMDAFENGHDAVMMTNYTRPGGKAPETVFVVRDQNQLRSPFAVFDPAKINSRDLLASFVSALGGGLAAFGSTPPPADDDEQPAP